LHCYNIHNILTIRSEVLLYELEYFRCQDIPYDADLTIKAVGSLGGKFNFRRKIIIEDELRHPNRLKYTEHLGPFGAQFEVNFIATKIEILVNRIVSASNHVLYVNLVEPLLRFLFIPKGYLLLHSACMSSSMVDQGLLISAPPDTGKTNTVLKCVKNGFSFLSDDMTILRLPNEALCFPKPMTISSHTFRTASTISESKNNGNCTKRSGLKLRSMIHSKKGRQLMRKLGNLNVPIFTINALGQKFIKPPKFNIDYFFPDPLLKVRTKIYNLVFLETGLEGEHSINVESDIATIRAIENTDDAFMFPPYREILKYLTIDGRSANDLLEVEKHQLEEFLSNITCTIVKSENRLWYKALLEFYCTFNDRKGIQYTNSVQVDDYRRGYGSVEV
jgi:dolichol-phosphate mannosyltransferase